MYRHGKGAAQPENDHRTSRNVREIEPSAPTHTDHDYGGDEHHVLRCGSHGRQREAFMGLLSSGSQRCQRVEHDLGRDQQDEHCRRLLGLLPERGLRDAEAQAPPEHRRDERHESG